MATRKANIAVPLMLLTLQQVFNSDAIGKASAQGVGQSRTNNKDDRIEPKTDRPWDAPLPGPHSTDLSVHGITTTDVAHLWIVGRECDEKNMPHPIVLRSTDEGNTWQKRRLDDGMFPFDIFFVDDQVGWIAGADGLVLRAQTAEHRGTSNAHRPTLTLCCFNSSTGALGGLQVTMASSSEQLMEGEPGSHSSFLALAG